MAPFASSYCHYKHAEAQQSLYSLPIGPVLCSCHVLERNFVAVHQSAERTHESSQSICLCTGEAHSALKLCFILENQTVEKLWCHKFGI